VQLWLRAVRVVAVMLWHRGVALTCGAMQEEHEGDDPETLAQVLAEVRMGCENVLFEPVGVKGEWRLAWKGHTVPGATRDGGAPASTAHRPRERVAVVRPTVHSRGRNLPKQSIRDLMQWVHEEGYGRVVVLVASADHFTYHCKIGVEEVRAETGCRAATVEVVDLQSLREIPVLHALAPALYIVPPDAAEEQRLAWQQTQRNHQGLPLMLASDVMARWLALETGQLVCFAMRPGHGLPVQMGMRQVHSGGGRGGGDRGRILDGREGAQKWYTL
jgi:hypothetical protein